jgi:hypothetical protein
LVPEPNPSGAFDVSVDTENDSFGGFPSVSPDQAKCIEVTLAGVRIVRDDIAARHRPPEFAANSDDCLTQRDSSPGVFLVGLAAVDYEEHAKTAMVDCTPAFPTETCDRSACNDRYRSQVESVASSGAEKPHPAPGVTGECTRPWPNHLVAFNCAKTVEIGERFLPERDLSVDDSAVWEVQSESSAGNLCADLDEARKPPRDEQPTLFIDEEELVVAGDRVGKKLDFGGM